MSLQVVISSCKMQRNGGFEIKPPFPIGVLKRLLYDGFFLLPSSGRFNFIYC